MNGCDQSMIKDGICTCAYYDRGHCLDKDPTYNSDTNQFICPITYRRPVENDDERDTGYYQPEVFTL